MMGPDYTRPPVDAPDGLPLRAEGRRRHRQHRVVEAVRRSGARRADRRGARAQPERQGRGRQRRAGGRRADADALGSCFRRSATAATGERARTTEAGVAPELARAHPEPADVLPGAADRELGDRPVGPHPAPERSRARQPARHRRGAPRRDPVARRVGREQLPHSCAASTRSSRSRSRRSAPTANRCRLFKLQFQYGQVSQMNVAQVAVAVRDRGGADPADRVADRADRERAVGAARPQSGPDRARQVDRRAGAADGARRACPRSCSSAGPTCCRPSSS